MKASDWKPIETAQKPALGEHSPSRYLLGFIPETIDPDDVNDPKSQISVIWWEPLIVGGCWYSDVGVVSPTHYMPLPDPPAK